jgi:hypothetical protein
MPYTADALQHSDVRETGGELRFQTPKEFRLSMRDVDIKKALKHLNASTTKISIVFVDASPAQAQPPAAQDDTELTGRALADPEVQRFRETFGGQVRAVRNLKD